MIWHIRGVVWWCGNLAPYRCLVQQNFVPLKALPLEEVAVVAKSRVCASRMVRWPGSTGLQMPVPSIGFYRRTGVYSGSNGRPCGICTYS
jgi:hypothetical protein